MTASRAQMGMDEAPDVWQSPAGQRVQELEEALAHEKDAAAENDLAYERLEAENARLTAEVNALRGKLGLAEARAADGVEARKRVKELEHENARLSAALDAAATPDPRTEEARLMALMRDPRYWRDRDPAVVEQVTSGFKRLYPRDPTAPGEAVEGREVEG